MNSLMILIDLVNNPIIIQKCAAWGVIVPAVISLAGMVGNMIQKKKASKQMKADNERLYDEQKSLTDWYEAEANRPITETSQGKSVLSVAAENYKDAIKKSEGASAATGGTVEASVATKGNLMESYNSVLNSMLGAGTEYKLGMKKEYQNALQTMGTNQFNMNAMQLASTSNAVGNASGALASIAATTDWDKIFGNMGGGGGSVPSYDGGGSQPGGGW